jgi:branched-chain amino acid transport system permease protein
MSTAVTTGAAPAARQPLVPRWVHLVVIWALLIAVPYWLPLLGGYTALAGRVLVFGLAAMGLNLLLGFTGVLSFGHAAYFGLGAYGAGLTLRYLVHSTPLAMLAGTLRGGLAGTLFGLPSASSGTTSPIAGTISPAASTVCAIFTASRSGSGR